MLDVSHTFKYCCNGSIEIANNSFLFIWSIVKEFCSRDNWCFEGQKQSLIYWSQAIIVFIFIFLNDIISWKFKITAKAYSNVFMKCWSGVFIAINLIVYDSLDCRFLGVWFQHITLQLLLKYWFQIDISLKDFKV